MNIHAQSSWAKKLPMRGVPVRKGKTKETFFSPDDVSLSGITKQGSPINLFPNPNDGSMILQYELAQGEHGKFFIFDMTGRKLSEYKLASTETKFLINEFLVPGSYFYSFTINGNPAKIGKLAIIK